MKKVLALMALMLPVVAQGVSIQTIKMGWKSKVITNVPTSREPRTGTTQIPKTRA